MGVLIVCTLALLLAVNSATLYSVFFSYMKVNESHLSSRIDISAVDLVLDRGIWLVKNAYQPTPFDRARYQDNNFMVEVEPGRYVKSQLTIDLVVKGSDHTDSTYEITAEMNQYKRVIRLANGKVVDYS